ncbi:MAG: hypothetical protein M3Q10_17350 [Chloroflexota bacterium]|nr:hypothetical protein [Chloroflexota bacterium]
MAKWDKKTLRMDEDHGWRCKPGYTIFVADRGAVRFDFPEAWVIVTDEEGIKLHDVQPPDDNCRLQLSVFRFPAGLNWTGVPLASMLEQSVDKDNEDRISRSPIAHVLRPGLEIVWTEVRRIDPGEKREARSRHLFAGGADVATLITLDYWPEDAPRFEPVWDEVLRSLRLGEYVADPRRGPQRPRRPKRG